MKRTGVCLLTLLLGLPAPNLRAQETPEPEGKPPVVGDRVRITTAMFFPGSDPKGRIVGRVVALDDEAVTLALGGDDEPEELAIPLDTIDRLEVKRGSGLKRVAGFTAGLGILGGVLTPLIAKVDCGLLRPGDSQPEDCDKSTWDHAREGAIAGAVTGAALGLLWAAMGGWEDSKLPGVRVAIIPRRSGVGVSVSYSF